MADQRLLPVEGIFDRAGRERKLNRLLDKAVAKRVRTDQKTAHGTFLKLPNGLGQQAQKKRLGESLTKALSANVGGASKNRVSLRQKAPDTGGRSFHFEHYSVSKLPPQKALPAGDKGSAPAEAVIKPINKPGSASAHQSYIEREAAVEADTAPNKDAEIVIVRKRGRPSKADLKARQHAALEKQTNEIERQVGKEAAAAQAYIENPTKLRNGEMGVSSFGNIGKTFEERLRFWELVEEHEPMPNARIQNRLIVELPHQSTPAARIAIMQEFITPFAEKGLPYHVAIHAPGEKNDHRNYHAHVIFSERPAKKMKHPDTGEDVWDFTIVETYRKKNRVKKTRHPYRQNRDRKLKHFSYVADLRTRFAKIVTERMKDIDPSVKFDPRSYKAMGLEIAPIRTINRVLHDLMRAGAVVVHNPEWTRRMIEAEMAAGAQRRDPEVVKLIDSTKALESLRDAWPSLGEINKHLHPSSRLITLIGFTRNSFRKVIKDRIRVETEIAKERIMAKVEIAVCRSVANATKPLSAKLPGRKPPRTAEEEVDMALLHETAREDIDAAKLRLKEAERTAKLRLRANRADFRSAAKTPEPRQVSPGFANGILARPTGASILMPSPTPPQFENGSEMKASGVIVASLREAQATPGSVQPSQQEEAKVAVAAALVAEIGQAMSAMYDPTLRGQAFADSLKPFLDQLHPERGGKHDPANVGDEVARIVPETPGQELVPVSTKVGRTEAVSPKQKTFVASQVSVAKDFAFPEPIVPRSPFRIPGREGTPSRVSAPAQTYLGSKTTTAEVSASQVAEGSKTVVAAKTVAEAHTKSAVHQPIGQILEEGDARGTIDLSRPWQNLLTKSKKKANEDPSAASPVASGPTSRASATDPIQIADDTFASRPAMWKEATQKPSCSANHTEKTRKKRRKAIISKRLQGGRGGPER